MIKTILGRSFDNVTPLLGIDHIRLSSRVHATLVSFKLCELNRIIFVSQEPLLFSTNHDFDILRLWSMDGRRRLRNLGIVVENHVKYLVKSCTKLQTTHFE